MKKYLSIFIVCIAAMISCTVQKDNTSNRSDENLAQFATNLCSVSSDDVIVTLTSLLRDTSVTLFKDGFDTTVAANTFKDSLHLTLLSIPDSLMNVSSVGDKGITFSGTVKLNGRDTDGQPLWLWKVGGSYSEKNDLSCTFDAGDEGLSYLWTKYYYIHDYGTVDSVFVAAKTGVFTVETMSGTEILDKIQLTFKGKDGSSHTILH